MKTQTHKTKPGPHASRSRPDCGFPAREVSGRSAPEIRGVEGGKMKLATIINQKNGRKIALHGEYQLRDDAPGSEIRLHIVAGPRREDVETSGSWCANRKAAKASGLEAIELSWGRGWGLEFAGIG